MIRIVSVEGNIGSGKSTFLKFVAKELANTEGVIILPEPVDKWEELKDQNGSSIIELFYKDKDKYAFPFQMMAYISRLALLREAVDKLAATGGGIIVCERSLLCDRYVFASMLRDSEHIGEVEFLIYTKWFDHFIKDLPRHHMLYLRTSPEIALQRVKGRDRKGEEIPLSYLQACHDYHDRWLDGPQVEIVDANVGKTDVVYRDWIQLILGDVMLNQNCVIASA